MFNEVACASLQTKFFIIQMQLLIFVAFNLSLLEMINLDNRILIKDNTLWSYSHYTILIKGW